MESINRSNGFSSSIVTVINQITLTISWLADIIFNEQAVKTRTSEERLSTTNLINFWPPTVTDLIFQHLSTKEVLKSTEVSPAWNYYLTSVSPISLEKIVFKANRNNFLLLLTSKRRYQNVVADNLTYRNLVDIICKPDRKWRSVEISNTKFDKPSQLQGLIERISKTAEIIALNFVARKDAKRAFKRVSFDFPKLKDLSIRNLYERSPGWFTSMFRSAPQLQEIKIRNASDVHMKELLATSQQLKKIRLIGNLTDEDWFKYLTTRISAGIESLTYRPRNLDSNIEGLNEFLKVHSPTLKCIIIMDHLNIDSLEICFAMPKLLQMSIYGYQFADIDREAGRWLTLLSLDAPQSSLIFFESTWMCQILLELLAKFASGLKAMEIGVLVASDASNQEWFPKLKSILVDCSVMQHDIIDKPVKSHLEELILTALAT